MIKLDHKLSVQAKTSTRHL